MSYAVLHIMKASGSCIAIARHIERSTQPDNAHPELRHLNRDDFIKYPNGVAGLERGVRCSEARQVDQHEYYRDCQRKKKDLELTIEKNVLSIENRSLEAAKKKTERETKALEGKKTMIEGYNTKMLQENAKLTDANERLLSENESLSGSNSSLVAKIRNTPKKKSRYPANLPLSNPTEGNSPPRKRLVRKKRKRQRGKPR